MMKYSHYLHHVVQNGKKQHIHRIHTQKKTRCFMFWQHGLYILVVSDNLAFTCMFTKCHKKYVMSEKCTQHIKHQCSFTCFIHITPVAWKSQQHQLNIMNILFQPSLATNMLICITDVTACQIKHHKKLSNVKNST